MLPGMIKSLLAKLLLEQKAGKMTPLTACYYTNSEMIQQFGDESSMGGQSVLSLALGWDGDLSHWQAMPGALFLKQMCLHAKCLTKS